MKKVVKYSIFSVLGIFLILIIEHILTKKRRDKLTTEWLNNQSGFHLWCKPENYDKPFLVSAYSNTYSRIDGFKFKGNIYKISNGIITHIDKNGSITFLKSNASIVEKIVSIFETKLIQNAPDNTWNALFKSI